MKRYGWLAEFDTAQALVAAAKASRAAGYRRVEAYAPFPVEELVEALGSYKDRVPLITLIGGILGGAGGYFMQWYSAVIAYPLNLGGRPYHSWPSFIPVTFELTILGAALFAVLGMLVLNGLPKLYHPLFNVPEFELASRNRFFLCLRSDDRTYERDRTRRFLESLNPRALTEVPE
jgi:ActD protein